MKFDKAYLSLTHQLLSSLETTQVLASVVGGSGDYRIYFTDYCEYIHNVNSGKKKHLEYDNNRLTPERRQ